ncbi:TPA: hypothetical protein O8L70_004297 [Enterobacter hormaechei]|nr:hypothetical protein [Enterobacter cloacae]HDC4362154.1 hypothetical protein [Enterobacter hormaechei]
MIENRTGTLGSLLRHNRNCGGTVKERDIELHNPNEEGGRFYIWLRDTADSLLSVRTE